VVLDIADVPFVPSRLLKKTFVSKLKMSDDHNLGAFTLDIGNMESLTGGVKDLVTGKYLPVKLEKIG
jgi:protease II